MAFLGVCWGNMGDALMMVLLGSIEEAQRAWCWQSLQKKKKKSQEERKED